DRPAGAPLPGPGRLAADGAWLRSGRRLPRAARSGRLRRGVHSARPAGTRARQRRAGARLTLRERNRYHRTMSEEGPTTDSSSQIQRCVMDVQEKIRQQVSDNKVVLYMKGTPDAPQ